jgi:hypothetical protein
MTDIVSTISSIDLNVLGGPTTIELAVDYGQRGDRGSLILYGQGKPALVSLPTAPAVYDMYVNLLPSDDEYQWVYQYISQPSGYGWKALFKLNPNTYSGNKTLTFINGSTEVWIPIVSITGGDIVTSSITSGSFNVQHSVIAQNPVASSVSVGDIALSPDEILALPITIKAAEFVSGEWALLSGEKQVHLFITMV